MFKRALTLMMVVAAVGAAGLLSPGPVDATGHSAARSFSAATATGGGTLDVTITVDSPGGFASQVTETLPDGFGYVSSNLSDAAVTTDGQDVTFTLLTEESFTYTVSVPNEAGTHTFHGVVLDSDRDSREVGGDADVMVTPAPTDELNASRSFSASTVEAGGELTVTITAGNYGQFGEVVETLPAGFGYTSTSLDDPPFVAGQMLSFVLFGNDSFTYTVVASRTLGAHEFSGVVKSEDRMQADVGGDSTVTVEAATAAHSATRSVDDTRVEAGAEVTVAIELDGLGAFGRVTETLPAGFAYVSSSLADEQVESADGTVTFTVLGENSFTYTVTASDMDGDHAFSGSVANDAKESAETGGDASVAVGDTVVTSDGGNVMLTITPDAQSTYFKGRIVEGCEAGPEGVGEVALCAIIDAWDAAGAEIVGFSLDAPSTLTIALTAEQVTGIGGAEKLGRLDEAGGLKVLTGAGEEWTEQESTVTVGEDGSATLSISITDFGGVAVAVDQAVLPATGAMTPPGWLVLALALTGAAMVPTGLLLRRRRRIEA